MTTPTGSVAGGTATRTGFKEMRRFGHLGIHPFVQGQGSDSVLARPHRLATPTIP